MTARDRADERTARDRDEVPQITVDMTGEIVALNDAAEVAFPDLPARGLDHPLLKDAPTWLQRLKEEGEVRERVQAGGRPYHVHMSFDPGAGVITFLIYEA